MANNVNSIYNLLQKTLAVLTSTESCISYFRKKLGTLKEERVLSQGLLTNTFISTLLGVMDAEKASSLSPELNNEDIPVKFNIILKGFRDRLMTADVMLNQLDMNTYATSNHKVFIAVPDHDDRDNGAEMDSNNKPEQQVRVPEFRALVAEIRQLKNQMVSAAEGAGGNNKHIHKPSGGGEYKQKP